MNFKKARAKARYIRRSAEKTSWKNYISSINSSITSKKFLKTDDENPLIVVSVSMDPKSEYPCKVDVVWTTNETETLFDRNYWGYYPVKQRSNKKGMQNKMLRITLKGEFRHIATTSRKCFDGMALYQASSPYGIEQIIHQSSDSNCAIFRSMLTRQTSQFDFRVRLGSLTDNSEIKCLENVMESLPNSRKPNERFSVPSKDVIDSCRSQCIQHRSCSLVPPQTA
uniref:Putative lipocalin-3 1 n=1 Tax=Amblyomma triste TaxID=251400 RepID=A0A023G6H9_AMBTT